MWLMIISQIKLYGTKMSNALFIVTARLTAVFVGKCKAKAFIP